MKINQKENRNKKENKKKTKSTLFVLDTNNLRVDHRKKSYIRLI